LPQPGSEQAGEESLSQLHFRQGFVNLRLRCHRTIGLGNDRRKSGIRTGYVRLLDSAASRSLVENALFATMQKRCWPTQLPAQASLL
jgi:hypothetical protein